MHGVVDQSHGPGKGKTRSPQDGGFEKMAGRIELVAKLELFEVGLFVIGGFTEFQALGEKIVEQLVDRSYRNSCRFVCAGKIAPVGVGRLCRAFGTKPSGSN